MGHKRGLWIDLRDRTGETQEQAIIGFKVWIRLQLGNSFKKRMN